MDVFVYNPATQLETVEAFNARLHTYCTDRDVVGVVPSAAGDVLLLSLTCAEDLPTAALCLAVQVVEVRADANLESLLSDWVAHFAGKSTENAPYQPVETTLMAAGGRLFAVFKMLTGIIEGDPS